MASKRSANWDNQQDFSYGSASKRARVASTSNTATPSLIPVRPSLPRTIYRPHPKSGVGKEFHSVPYPLTLLPKQSWEALTRGDPDGAICASCGKSRPSTAHQRKLFLVAERLSWELGTVSYAARSQNEVSLWAVNAELDIYDPAVDDEDLVIGGRKSRQEGECFPFRSKVEAEMAMTVVERAEILGENSWQLWRNMADMALSRSTKSENEELVDLTGDVPVIKHTAAARVPMRMISPNSNLAQIGASPSENGKSAALTSPLTLAKPNTATAMEEKCSYRTLSDFYSLLDKIERTSPMGARFLEAYAERLHSETCKDCWFERNVVQDLLRETPEPDVEPAHENKSSSPAFAPAPLHRSPPTQSLQQPLHPLAQPGISHAPASYGMPDSSNYQPARTGPSQYLQRTPASHHLNQASYSLPAAHTAPRAPIAPPTVPEPEPPSAVQILAHWARADPRLAALFDAVAKRTATPQQVRDFNFYATAARNRAPAEPRSQPQPQTQPGAPYARRIAPRNQVPPPPQLQALPGAPNTRNNAPALSRGRPRPR